MAIKDNWIRVDGCHGNILFISVSYHGNYFILGFTSFRVAMATICKQSSQNKEKSSVNENFIEKNFE